MLVLCDFDGTYTEQDVTNMLLDEFGNGYDWRTEQLIPFRAGQLTHLDIMRNSYQHVTATEAELMEYAFQHTVLRPGFDGLQQLCAEQGWVLAIVSGGLDFYIKAFLPPGVPYYSYQASLDQYWRVTLPPYAKPPEVQDFKVQVLEQLRQQHGATTSAFIGDGRNDFAVSLHADIRFSVAGSGLSKLLAEANLPHTDFTDFATVTAELRMKDEG